MILESLTEVRFQCLVLAQSAPSNGFYTTSRDVLERAEEYYEFVSGVKKKPPKGPVLMDDKEVT